METGASYAAVLADAQALGYAEADPSPMWTASMRVRAVHPVAHCHAGGARSGHGRHADDLERRGGRLCLRQGVEVHHPPGFPRAVGWKAGACAGCAMLVPLESPIAWSHGTQNMVVTTGRFGGDVVFSGHGAGGEPTAVAVVSDILAVAQRSVAVELPVRRRQVTGEFLAPHYLRFVVDDKPGIVAGIAGALAKVGANIDSLLQHTGTRSTGCRLSSPRSHA